MTENPGNTNVEPETPQVLIPSPNQLVDREDQLKKFTDVLERISRQGPVSSNLFEWYGSPGIGKSMLVTMLSHRAAERQAAWSLINFKTSAGEIPLYLHDPTLIIEGIISDLKKQASLDTGEFDSAIREYRTASLPDEGVVSAYSAMDQATRLYQRPDWLTELRNVVVAFIKLINLLPSQAKADRIRPVVLFFDETEHADIELVDWIEEWIINPLIQVKHCVVVWTARRPWRWKRPEIRRRLTSEMLKVFEIKEVQDQIQYGSAKPDLVSELFKNVYTLTGGHPFANYIVINELDSLVKQGKKITPENFQDFESRLLEEVFDRFVNQYAFNELESNDLKIACKFISLVRLFDSTMLRRILQACAGDLFAPWSQDDFGDLLLKLKKTQLLVWEKGYAIDPGLRHIVQKYFMVLDRNTFITANRAALQVYEDWLGRPVDNRSLFVLEELYHSAALAQAGERIDLPALLDKRLKEYPNWIRDEQALENALDRLGGEIKHDKELEQFTLSNAELARQVEAFKDEQLSLLRSRK
ncbi:MAG: ATP-binding protein [Chloroflexi bacterium]|nr:MAG: ATP-binding protein [Chloroflexota bacterium]